jgi:hypothetical protein
LSPLKLIIIELAVKGGVGLLLVLVPLTSIKLLGLPRSDTAFWPRLLGALLIALALATYMDATIRLGHGLSLTGALVINVALALTLVGLLTSGQGPQTRRGRILLWLTTAVLATLALVELAFV